MFLYLKMSLTKSRKFSFANLEWDKAAHTCFVKTAIMAFKNNFVWGPYQKQK